MNAITHPAPLAEMPGADAAFVSVRINRAQYRVYHTLGRPFWVSRVEPCGYVWPGRDVRDVAVGSNQAAAVTIARHLLAGLDFAGDRPAPANDDAAPVMPFWSFVAGSIAFAASAMVLMWGVIILAWTMGHGR